MQAAAYLRTSSMANAGEASLSYQRQADAVRAYARGHNLQLAKKHVYYDAGVSGATPLGSRPSFNRRLQEVVDNKVTMVLFEDSTRLARDLVVQELTLGEFSKHGVSLISCKSPTMFTDDSLTAKLVRQILGAVSEYQKCDIHERLSNARARKMVSTPHRTLDGRPKVVGRKNRLGNPALKKVRRRTNPMRQPSRPRAQGVHDTLWSTICYVDPCKTYTHSFGLVSIANVFLNWDICLDLIWTGCQLGYAPVLKVLQPWVTKEALAKGDLAKAVKALSKKGIKTAKGKDVSVAQVKTWLEALRKDSGRI